MSKIKYEFFAADNFWHRPKLEQFEAENDTLAQVIIMRELGGQDQAIFRKPVVTNPAALYGRSWFVYISWGNNRPDFAGYLYTTGRPANGQ